MGKTLETKGLLLDLLEHFAKKNWLHTEEFDKMIEKNTNSIESKEKHHKNTKKNTRETR